MSFDIYGNNLRSGHCEAHPWVHEPYPCPLCFSDADRQQQERQDAELSRRAEEDAYYEAMRQAMIEELIGVGGDGI